MAWVEIRDFDQSGVVSDMAPRALPLNAVTDVTNMNFQNGKLMKILGYSTVYGTPSIAPYHLQFSYTSEASPWLIYCGLADVYTYAGNAHTKITRTLSTYAATKNNDWTSTILGGIPILNDGVNPPQYTTSPTTTLLDLTNWPATWSCRAIRAYREFLVALDMTENGSDYPAKLRWSHPADPGSLPVSWDETDTTKDAGYKAFSETPGILIDCLPLGSVNIVYKDDSAYAMQYVGGQFVFSFNKIFDIGVIGRNCIAEVEGKHVFMSPEDIYIHNGGQPTSLLHKRIREEIYGSIDQAYRTRSRVLADRNKQQVWFFIPTNGTGWLNEAWVWNWRDNTWGNVSVPNLSCAAVGAEVGADQAWDSDTLTWDSDNTVWNNSLVASAQLVWGSAINTKLYQANYLNQAEGVNYLASAERKGLDFGDPNSIKVVRKVRPHFNNMTDGTNVTISVGTQNQPDDTPVWTDKTYVVGTDIEVWPLVRGRYLSWKVAMTANDALELESLEFDVVKNGTY